MAHTHSDISSDKNQSRHRNPRFQVLMALADDGDENAMADLFKEFGYPYPACAQK